jgi:hypothetical protein
MVPSASAHALDSRREIGAIRPTVYSLQVIALDWGNRGPRASSPVQGPGPQSHLYGGQSLIALAERELEPTVQGRWL